MKAPVLAWTTLSVNIIVILQGAVVRATGSGAGCGRDWPRCQGELVPLDHGLATWLEFSHRALSGLALLIGLWLLVSAVRLRRQLPGLLFFAILSAVLLLIEALIGAFTVLTGLTGDDVSVARGLLVAFHLLNSMLLVGALALATAHAYPGQPERGNSKGLVVDRYRQLGYHVIYVGDGRSDFEGAERADTVFAHSFLAEECQRQEVAFRPFTHFGEVLETTRELMGRAGT